MKKFCLLLPCCLLLSLSGYSQTKKIALASHSGSASELNFDGEDNFGLTKEMRERYRAADTIRTKDTVAVPFDPTYPPQGSYQKQSQPEKAILPKKGKKVGNKR